MRIVLLTNKKTVHDFQAEEIELAQSMGFPFKTLWLRSFIGVVSDLPRAFWGVRDCVVGWAHLSMLILRLRMHSLRAVIRQFTCLVEAVEIVNSQCLCSSDVVFAYWFSRATITAYYIHLMRGNRYIVQAHGSDLFLYPPENAKEIVRSAIGVLTISDSNKNWLSTTYELPADAIHVFRMGASTFVERQALSDSFSRGAKPRNEPTRFVFAGRFEHVKGIDMLVEILNQLALVRDDWEITVAGEGSAAHSLQKLSRKAEAHVYRSGWLSPEALWNRLRVSQFVLLTSRSEGVPVVLMEAAAAGTIPISFDVGSVGEIIADESTGILVPPFEIEAYVRSMIAAIEMDVSRFLTMSERLRERYCSEFVLSRNLSKKWHYLANRTVHE